MNPARTLVARITAAVTFARLGSFIVLRIELPLPLLTQALIADVVSFGLLGLLLGLCLSPYGFKRTWLLALASALVAPVQIALRQADALELLSEIPASAGHGLMAGALLGLAQLPVLWRLLRRRALWPVMLALGWGMAFAVTWTVAGLALESSPDDFTIILGACDVLASMIIGGITGIAFLLLGDTDERARRSDETGEEHHR